MGNIIADNIALILLLPLWIFLIIMCGRFFSVYVNKAVIYFLTLFSSFLGIGACAAAIFNLSEPLIWNYTFIKIKDFVINFGLQIDKLSLIVALVLFVVSFAVQLFSISYMKNEKKNYKFFAFLNLFNFSMAFLLFSPNLFQFYIFWELVSVTSYLLIGFDYKNKVKSEASRRVFLINRFGDMALFAGIVLVSCIMYEYGGNNAFVTLSFEDFNSISTLLMAYTSTPIYCLICGLFIAAAAVKSAQFPFYTWLQDAMEAEIPVSALLHSATMVVAGVYLIIKMLSFFTLNILIMKIILILGLVTALICSMLASVETHPKKVLAYSTSANLGLMFFALGTGNIWGALMLLVAHAFIKSSMFLSLPNAKINGIGYSRYIFFCINGLCLAGILFSGLGAKEIIFEAININYFAVLYMVVSFISAYYITRLAILIYKNNEFTHTYNKIKALSFGILLCGNIALYLMLRQYYLIAEPYAAAIGGIAVALLLAKHNLLEKFNSTPKLIEKFYNKVIPNFYNIIAERCNFVDNRILSNYKIILNVLKLPVKIIGWMETNIMNESVLVISYISKAFSKYDKCLQSGNVQTYNAYALIITTIVITLVIVGYTMIFG